jgi:hypothetical protein
MQSIPNLSRVPDDELLRRLAALLAGSRRTEADLVAHVGEVDARKLYAREATPSMFQYCTEGLHLSGGRGLPAHRRGTRRPRAPDHPHDAGGWTPAPHRDRAARAPSHAAERGRPAAAGHAQVEARDRGAPGRDRSPAGCSGDDPEAAGEDRRTRTVAGLAGEFTFARTANRPGSTPLRADEPPSAPRFGLAPSPARHSTPTSALPPHDSETAAFLPQLRPDEVVSNPSVGVAAPPGMIEPLSPARYKVQFTASAELRDKLERLRALMRSSGRDADLASRPR